jgi:hypothetical protein
MSPDEPDKTADQKTEQPKPKEAQNARDWFLRGLDMAVMPFTDRARAWAGFRKDVLNMKGGFIMP